MDIRRISFLADPSEFPLSLDDVKLDLRVDDGDEDATLRRMMQTAAGLIERKSGYVIQPGEFMATLGADEPCELTIPYAPFRELLAVELLTGRNDWTQCDLGDFQVTETSRGAIIAPYCPASGSWPVLYSDRNSIRLRFSAGYDVDDMSEGESEGEKKPFDNTVRGVFIALCAHYYENRELFASDKLTEIESTAGGLLNSIRAFW
jgi:uncharacterized phiE125 gp8 family phage protein